MNDDIPTEIDFSGGVRGKYAGAKYEIVQGKAIGKMPPIEGIKCLKCGRTSYNRNDVVNRYCGHCHVFHDEPG